MKKEEIKEILAMSILLREKKQGLGTLVLSNIEEEVINNACLYILKAKKMGYIVDPKYIFSVSSLFTTCARELFHEYTHQYEVIAIAQISQNLEWEGMWVYLRNYFYKHHEVSIDESSFNSIIFHSSFHCRYDDGILLDNGIKVLRTINLTFMNNNQELHK